VAGGEHNGRPFKAATPQLSHRLKAVHFGPPDIQDDEVLRLVPYDLIGARRVVLVEC